MSTNVWCLSLHVSWFWYVLIPSLVMTSHQYQTIVLWQHPYVVQEGPQVISCFIQQPKYQIQYRWINYPTRNNWFTLLRLVIGYPIYTHTYIFIIIMIMIIIMMIITIIMIMIIIINIIIIIYIYTDSQSLSWLFHLQRRFLSQDAKALPHPASSLQPSKWKVSPLGAGTSEILRFFR